MLSANVPAARLRVKVGGKPVLDGDRHSERSADSTAACSPSKPRSRIRRAPARVELLWQGPGFVARTARRISSSGTCRRNGPGASPATCNSNSAASRSRNSPASKLPQAGRERQDGEGARRTRRAEPHRDREARATPAGSTPGSPTPRSSGPHTTMPRCSPTTNRPGRALRRHEVPRLALRQPLDPYRPPVDLRTTSSKASNAAACSSPSPGVPRATRKPKPKPKNEEDDREPLKPEDYIFGLGTSPARPRSTSLGAVGSKTPAGAARRVPSEPAEDQPRRPHAAHEPEPAGSDDIARYLCRVTDDERCANPASPKTRPPNIAGRVRAF